MKKFALTAVAASVLLSACASIPLDPSATRVISSTNPAPKSCKYKGQVVGNQGNFLTGGWTSNRNLEEGAMNDMKNQAAKLGANYIQVVNSRAGDTGSASQWGGNYTETNVTNLGNAYSCKPSDIGL